MLTRDNAYNIIQELNESAHRQSWDTWEEADSLADSDDEADWETAEDLRAQASAEQAEYFREEFEALDEEIRDAIMHWVNADTDFRDEFVSWYGEDEYEADFG